MNDYISKIRTKIAQDKIIHPAARILIENEHNEFLFIERADNQQLAIPAGALEENETIEACIIREVKEETGLSINQLQVIGISSNPEVETVQYPNGDIVQYFTIEFYSKDWNGSLKTIDVDEVKSVAFKPKTYLKELAPNEKSIVDSWAHYQATGKIKVK